MAPTGAVGMVGAKVDTHRSEVRCAAAPDGSRDCLAVTFHPSAEVLRLHGGTRPAFTKPVGPGAARAGGKLGR